MQLVRSWHFSVALVPIFPSVTFSRFSGISEVGDVSRVFRTVNSLREGKGIPADCVASKDDTCGKEKALKLFVNFVFFFSRCSVPDNF